MRDLRKQIAAVLALAAGLTMAPLVASAKDIDVTVQIHPLADFTLFAMIGNDIVWRSKAGSANAPLRVPSSVKGKPVSAICVRLGKDWRVHSKDGQTYQASCFAVEKSMRDAGATGYSMSVETGRPNVPMPDGL